MYHSTMQNEKAVLR